MTTTDSLRELLDQARLWADPEGLRIPHALANEMVHRLARLSERHRPSLNHVYCIGCEESWPCDDVEIMNGVLR